MPSSPTDRRASLLLRHFRELALLDQRAGRALLALAKDALETAKKRISLAPHAQTRPRRVG